MSRRIGRPPAALAALAALAVAPLAGLLVRVWAEGGRISGADGLLVLDQMQYLNWLRQAGAHGLIANLYDLAGGPRTFLHPGLVVSGLLHELGLGTIAAYLVWKPVAVLALWWGAAAWGGRFLEVSHARAAVIAVALLFASPIAAVVGWTGLGGGATRLSFDFLSGELTVGNSLWGYPFTAIAVGLLPLALLAYERGHVGRAAAAGLLVAWLQPWQGATLALIVGATEAVRWAATRERPAPRAPVVVCGVIALPLLYYLVLSKADPSWELAGTANDFGTWPLWVTLVGLGPFVLPALGAPRPDPASFGEVALRVWPLAALAVYVLPFGTFPAHALQGLMLPLAVLAFLGAAGRLHGWALAAVLAVLIGPGTLYRADQLRGAVQAGRQPFFLRDGESAALDWLDRSGRPGGVLAPIYTGLLVPAYTQRETWVGAGSWTPDFDARVQAAEALFSARMDRAGAERLVRRSGARYLLSDCQGRADIGTLLTGVAGPPRRFGCATLWEVGGEAAAARR